ncbi:hypothetical protein V6Z90_009707 [Aspergillus fumigatus]
MSASSSTAYPFFQSISNFSSTAAARLTSTALGWTSSSFFAKRQIHTQHQCQLTLLLCQLTCFVPLYVYPKRDIKIAEIKHSTVYYDSRTDPSSISTHNLEPYEEDMKLIRQIDC